MGVGEDPNIQDIPIGFAMQDAGVGKGRHKIQTIANGQKTITKLEQPESRSGEIGESAEER